MRHAAGGLQQHVYEVPALGRSMHSKKTKTRLRDMHIWKI